MIGYWDWTHSFKGKKLRLLREEIGNVSDALVLFQKKTVALEAANEQAEKDARGLREALLYQATQQANLEAQVAQLERQLGLYRCTGGEYQRIPRVPKVAR